MADTHCALISQSNALYEGALSERIVRSRCWQTLSFKVRSAICRIQSLHVHAVFIRLCCVCVSLVKQAYYYVAFVNLLNLVNLVKQTQFNFDKFIFYTFSKTQLFAYA